MYSTQMQKQVLIKRSFILMVTWLQDLFSSAESKIWATMYLFWYYVYILVVDNFQDSSKDQKYNPRYSY